MCTGCLFRPLPLLKKRAERHSIQCVASRCIRHHYLAISTQKQLIQITPPAIPSFGTAQFIHTDLLGIRVSAEYLVNTKCTVAKLVIEPLCIHRQHIEHNQKTKGRYSSHYHKIINIRAQRYKVFTYWNTVFGKTTYKCF